MEAAQCMKDTPGSVWTIVASVTFFALLKALDEIVDTNIKVGDNTLIALQSGIIASIIAIVAGRHIPTIYFIWIIGLHGIVMDKCLYSCESKNCDTNFFQIIVNGFVIAVALIFMFCVSHRPSKCIVITGLCMALIFAAENKLQNEEMSSQKLAFRFFLSIFFLVVFIWAIHSDDCCDYVRSLVPIGFSVVSYITVWFVFKAFNRDA
jgi:hypothetical protein